MSIESWVRDQWRTSGNDDGEQGKVTIRLSVETLSRLSVLAEDMKLSRTKCAHGLLEAAVNEAYRLYEWRENDPVGFSEHLEQLDSEAALQAHFEQEALRSQPPLRVTNTDNHPAATMVVAASVHGVLPPYDPSGAIRGLPPVVAPPLKQPPLTKKETR